jgi:hypothetical protein
MEQQLQSGFGGAGALPNTPLHGGRTISWKSSKQTLIATSTNHSEIIALFEASHECVWLRKMIKHTQQ